MNPPCVSAIAIVLWLGAGIAQADTGSPCPVTLGSDEIFGAPFPAGKNWYGSESLAVKLPADGIWPTTKSGHLIAVKLFWWSAGFKPGKEKHLNATVTALHGAAASAKISEPTNAKAPDLGGWTMLTGIDFPEPGCWRISADYVGQSLSFVVRTIGWKDYLKDESR